MGGSFSPSPPGGVPGHSRIFSFGSLGITPSPGTTVSAQAGLAKAAASPVAIAVRRSIPCSFFVADRITLFLFCGQGVLFAPMRAILLLSILLISVLPAAAQDGPVYGPRLEGFDYPHPVQIFRFTSQKMPMEMAYMDVKPAKPNGRTVVL